MRLGFHREKWPRNKKGQMGVSIAYDKYDVVSKHTSHQNVSPTHGHRVIASTTEMETLFIHFLPR
jgi:hypothetical protein